MHKTNVNAKHKKINSQHKHYVTDNPVKTIGVSKNN